MGKVGDEVQGGSSGKGKEKRAEAPKNRARRVPKVSNLTSSSTALPTLGYPDPESYLILTGISENWRTNHHLALAYGSPNF